eukprot:jgi/Mesvir1/26937/Mv20658-RA.1
MAGMPASRFQALESLAVADAHEDVVEEDEGDEVTDNNRRFLVEGGLNGAKAGRLDAYLSSQMGGESRARIQFAIKEGAVRVNGEAKTKASHVVRVGDVVECVLQPLVPLDAFPEDIPLHVVYEDDHVLVVNKPPHMVVHPAPGHRSGTLVNAILHHCKLPGGYEVRVTDGEEEDSQGEMAGPVADGSSGETLATASTVDGDKEDELAAATREAGGPPNVRPGIVHRIDKGTSGLLVVAKTERAHASLSAQFKARAVKRTYFSIVNGVPFVPEGAPNQQGRVVAAIGRDPRERKRMAVLPENGSLLSRYAASRYSVLETFVGDGAALVQWNLETGRTHQIRVHAQHLGHPLLGDDTYGGGGRGTEERLISRATAAQKGRKDGASIEAKRIRDAVKHVLSLVNRPMLHAATLGFVHPATGKTLLFDSDMPEDMEAILSSLRAIT